MTTRELAYHLLQATYLDGINASEMSAACQALHEDVEWSHSQIWPHGDTVRDGKRRIFRGRATVESFLTGRRELLSEPRVFRRLGQFTLEGNIGCARSYIEAETGALMPLTLWFEIRDNLIGRYSVYPIVVAGPLTGAEAEDWRSGWRIPG